MQQEISKLAMNHNQPDNKNHSVIYCKQTIWVSEKKKCLQFYISFSYNLNPIMIPFISQDCSETFWQKWNFCSRIAISNCCSKSFSVKVKASFISNAKESFYHIQFLYTYTLCWSVPESNFIFPTNAKVTWKY